MNELWCEDDFFYSSTHGIAEYVQIHISADNVLFASHFRSKSFVICMHRWKNQTKIETENEATDGKYSLSQYMEIKCASKNK